MAGKSNVIRLCVRWGVIPVLEFCGVGKADESLLLAAVKGGSHYQSQKLI